MPKNKDTRDFTYNRLAEANFNPGDSAESVSNELPGDHRVRIERVNSFTGSPDDVQSINARSGVAGDTAAEPPNDAALINEALNHVDSITPVLGFMGGGQKPEFVPDSFVKKTSAGTSVVSLQQHYKGVPVFSMERTVIFDSLGGIKNTTGTNVELPTDLDTNPVVSLPAAAKAAAEYMTGPSDDVDPWTGEPLPELEIDVTGYEPEILGRISLPSQPAVVSKGPFAENIPAHLVVFYQGATTRLGWHFVITSPDMAEQFVIIVEADAQANAEKPEILYAQKTSSHMAAKGKVWVHNPGINPERELVDFPLPVGTYPIDSSTLGLPSDFPQSWIDDGGSMAIGNYTVAVTGNTTNSISGSTVDGVLTFDPGDAGAQGDIQKVINIFYFCNYMHDFFYMLGFDERHGNFQKINITGLGTGNDPVLARAHPGPVRGTANMLTLADGVRAEMNMGLVAGNINRHTAFDSDVVFHEFVHGVTNRLVGGRLDARGLREPQSRGMGEGWSDYFALSIQNCLALMKDPDAQEKTVTGDWVVKREDGIRLAPYDDNYPATYGDVGSGDYSEEHAVGEIWCAALMKLNRDFGAALDDKVRGHRIGWQVVVDGLKLTPANPSFLDARDAILRALEDLQTIGRLSEDEFASLNKAAWGAFARFGMGPNASSVGPSLEGITEDRNPPANL